MLMRIVRNSIWLMKNRVTMKANFIQFWRVESEFIVKNEFHNWTSELGCIWHIFGKFGSFQALQHWRRPCISTCNFMLHYGYFQNGMFVFWDRGLNICHKLLKAYCQPQKREVWIVGWDYKKPKDFSNGEWYIQKWISICYGSLLSHT